MTINILFVIPSLRTGGAERVISFLSTSLDKKKFNTHLLVIGSSEELSYDIDNKRTTFLNQQKVGNAIPAIIKFINKKKPKIVMSSISHLNNAMAIVSLFFPKIKFIGRETSIVSQIGVKPKLFSIWDLLGKLTVRQLSYVVCQSEDMKADLINQLNYPPDKLLVINNPIGNRFTVKRKVKNEINQFITVGRLAKIKGHKRIISALSTINTPFHYTIIGDGPEKDNLFKLAEELKMSEKITHIPFSDKIEDHLAKSDLFIQGSFSEGFPNALLESCAVGTPVLAFTAPGGTREIIEEGVNGFIVSNTKCFSEKCNQILLAKWEPEQVSKSVLNKFHESKILKQYEKFFIKNIT